MILLNRDNVLHSSVDVEPLYDLNELIRFQLCKTKNVLDIQEQQIATTRLSIVSLTNLVSNMSELIVNQIVQFGPINLKDRGELGRNDLDDLTVVNDTV